MPFSSFSLDQTAAAAAVLSLLCFATLSTVNTLRTVLSRDVKSVRFPGMRSARPSLWADESVNDWKPGESSCAKASEYKWGDFDVCCLDKWGDFDVCWSGFEKKRQFAIAATFEKEDNLF